MDSEACRISQFSPLWSGKSLQEAQMADVDIAQWLLKSEQKPTWPTVTAHSESTKK
jgi:hypothetical protein